MPAGFELFLKDWGPESLLSLGFIAVIIGLLVPRRTVRENQKLLLERVAEAREREKIAVAAFDKLQEAVVLQSRQMEKLSEQGEMTVALLQGIQRAAGSAPVYASVSPTGRHYRGET